MKRAVLAIAAATMLAGCATTGTAADLSARSTIIGHRPPGCPSAYCGCGLARYLGLHDRRLNVADNWGRLFPRTDARAGAVAVRRRHWHGHGHVMLLVRHEGGSRWLVKDFNGGRHLSWLHVRSVRGYIFVDPSQQIREARR